MKSKITILKLLPQFPGANELIDWGAEEWKSTCFYTAAMKDNNVSFVMDNGIFSYKVDKVIIHEM